MHPFVAELQVTVVDEAFRLWKEPGVETLSDMRDEPFGGTFALRDADGRVTHAMKSP